MSKLFYGLTAIVLGSSAYALALFGADGAAEYSPTAQTFVWVLALIQAFMATGALMATVDDDQ